MHKVFIPLYKNLSSRDLAGWQVIYPDGTKKFQFNTNPIGAFYPIIKSDRLMHSEVIYVCEGFCTAYSLSELVELYSDTQLFTVVACFSASNIVNVVREFRAMMPDKIMIVVADSDRAGIAAAVKAVEAGANKYIDICDDGLDVNDEWLKDKAVLLKRFTEKMSDIL